LFCLFVSDEGKKFLTFKQAFNDFANGGVANKLEYFSWQDFRAILMFASRANQSGAFCNHNNLTHIKT
jgi:hypothetical protein